MPTRTDGISGVRPGNGTGGSGTVEKLTEANFNEKVLRGNGPIVVEFMHPGCGFCRRANPIVHDLARSLAGQVTVFQVIAAESPNLAARYSVGLLPTFVMFEGGQVKANVPRPEITAFDIRRTITEPFEQ